MKDIKKIQIKFLEIISQYLRLKIHWMVLPTGYILQKKRLVNLNPIQETMQNGTQREKDFKSKNRGSVSCGTTSICKGLEFLKRRDKGGGMWYGGTI